MRPIRLEMQAFGPYKGREVIDFAKLSEDGIFLIKGPTGSGKTSIFDAMTIALYGGCSGDMGKGKNGRNEFSAWRCNQSDDAVCTEIVFIFSVQDCTYRFTRKMELKRKNWSESQEAEWMDEKGVFHPFFENPKIAQVNQKAEELIGLSREQFTKVVLLPQGQFEKFLVADSSEKETILKKIFDTEQWERYAQRFYKKAEERMTRLSKMREKVTNSLAEEGKDFTKVDDIADYIKTQEAKVSELEEAHKAFNGEKRQKQLDEDRALYSQFRNLDADTKKQGEMLAKADDIASLRATLSDAEKAEELRSLIDEKSRLEADTKKRQTTYEALVGSVSTYEEAAQKAQEVLELHTQHSKVQENNEQIAKLKAKTPAYERIGELKNAMDMAEARRDRAETTQTQAVADWNKAVQNANRLAEIREDAEQLAADYRRRYYSGIYGEIASTQLTKGGKCPVCGSTHHPEPARRTPDSVSKADVEAKEAEVDTAKENWKKADTLQETRKQAKEAALERLTEARAAFATAKAEYDAAMGSIEEGIASLAELNRRIAALEDDNRKYQLQEEALKAAKETKANALVKLRTEISSAKTEWETVAKQLDEKQKELAAKLTEKGYASVEDVTAKLMSDAARKQMNVDITSYETSLKDLSERIKKTEEELAGKEMPDAETFDNRQREITEENRAFAGEVAQIQAENAKLQRKYDTLKAEVAQFEVEITQAENDYHFAQKLRGDSGVGLQRYVLGIMFDQVIVEANTMLEKVHGGRYHLFRTDDKGKGNKRGLELKVHDNRSPEKEGRGVAMLSGGEKFLVSLALSIGMSSVAAQSGVQMDSLFIDEGFGTLDETSIQDAMDVLACVQRANGLIGIISHVKLLESTIPSVIEVVKTKEGSRIKAV